MRRVWMGCCLLRSEPGLAPALRAVFSSLPLVPSPPSSWVCWPGVARRQVTFFCFAKRKSPKKRRPAVWVPPLRYGQPALLDCGGGLAKLASLRYAQTTRSLIPPPSALLGPARTGKSGIPKPNTEYQYRTPKQTRTRHGVSLFLWYSGSCLRLLGIGIWLFGIPGPLVDAPRSAGPGGSGIALFERSAA